MALGAVGCLLAELLCVFVAGVFGFFAMLLFAAVAIVTSLIGCAAMMFLLIALAESAWWLHTHSHHAAVTALGYYGYAAGSFGVITVLLYLKDKLTGQHERRQRRPTIVSN